MGYFIQIHDPLLRDNRVSASAKILYGHAFLMSIKTGYCWAANSVFSDLLNCDERSVRRFLSELINSYYVTVKNDGKNRQIYFGEPGQICPPSQNMPDKSVRVPADAGQICPGSGGEKPDKFDQEAGQICPHINTSIITSNTTTTEDDAGQICPPSPVVTPLPTNQPAASGQPIAPPPIPAAPAPFDFSAENSPWWNDQIAEFLSNQKVLETICIRGIKIDVGKELMRGFAEKRQFEGDVKSFAELRRHFANWFKNGFTEGYINPDGTYKNDKKNEQKQQSGWGNEEKSVAEQATDAFFRDFNKPRAGSGASAGN